MITSSSYGRKTLLNLPIEVAVSDAYFPSLHLTMSLMFHSDSRSSNMRYGLL